MRTLPFRQVFWLPNTLYKTVGYDFLGTSRPRWQQYLLNIFLFFSATSGLISRFYTFRQEYALIKARDTMNGIRLSIFVTYAIDSNIKFFAFLNNRQRLHKIYETLAQEYPQTTEAFRRYDVVRYYLSRRVHYVIYAYFAFTNAILLTPLLESIVRYAVDLVRLGIGEAAFAYLRPTPMPYSFDYHTPLRYMIVYVSEFMNGHFCTVTNVGTDMVLCLFVSQICMHFDYISRTLAVYEPSVEHEREDCEFLAELVRKHQLMFVLRGELDSIFGISLVFNLMSTTAVLCVTAVMLSVEGFGYEFSKFFGFFLGLIAQLFIVCRSGQQLITSSKNIALAGYKSQWYNGTMRYKKLLLLIIVRAQKRADLTAKGFHSISLETFQIMMGMTYRLFTVLNTMLH